MDRDAPLGTLRFGGKRGFDQQSAGQREIGFDGGQRRRAEGARTQPVEADHGNIVGDRNPARGEFFERAQRHGIAGEKQSVEARAAIDAAIAR